MTENSGRVLIVDDDRQTRLKLARDLEGGGFAVSEAAGADDFLSKSVEPAVLQDRVRKILDKAAK